MPPTRRPQAGAILVVQRAPSFRRMVLLDPSERQLEHAAARLQPQPRKLPTLPGLREVAEPPETENVRSSSSGVEK